MRCVCVRRAVPSDAREHAETAARTTSIPSLSPFIRMHFAALSVRQEFDGRSQSFALWKATRAHNGCQAALRRLSDGERASTTISPAYLLPLMSRPERG